MDRKVSLLFYVFKALMQEYVQLSEYKARIYRVWNLQEVLWDIFWAVLL